MSDIQFASLEPANRPPNRSFRQIRELHQQPCLFPWLFSSTPNIYRSHCRRWRSYLDSWSTVSAAKQTTANVEPVEIDGDWFWHLRWPTFWYPTGINIAPSLCIVHIANSGRWWHQQNLWTDARNVWLCWTAASKWKDMSEIVIKFDFPHSKYQEPLLSIIAELI